MEPFQVLLEPAAGAALPEPLAELYGELGFAGPTVFANFVASLDGIVRLADKAPGGAAIADHSPADRFVMGLLRATADAVLIGAGTLRSGPTHRWTAEYIAPDFTAAWRELRGARRAVPLVVVLTRSGDIDPALPGLSDRALILTTSAGRARLQGRLPESCALDVVEKDGDVDLGAAVERVRADAGDLILSEAGPNVTAQLIDRGLLDELFLTVSPLVAGRDAGYVGFADGRAFLPDRRIATTLVSVRRHGDHLFLRHRFQR